MTARLGDMSVRTGLTVHRGTPNRSDRARPVLILGVIGPEVVPGPHGLQLSTDYAAALPPELLSRLHAAVVPELEPSCSRAPSRVSSWGTEQT